MIEIKTEYYDNGSLYREVHYKNELLHREDGAAIIYYNYDGGIEELSWFYNDINYTDKVNKWMKGNNFNFFATWKENNFKSWENMKEEDFNRMWMELL